METRYLLSHKSPHRIVALMVQDSSLDSIENVRCVSVTTFCVKPRSDSRTPSLYTERAHLPYPSSVSFSLPRDGSSSSPSDLLLKCEAIWAWLINRRAVDEAKDHRDARSGRTTNGVPGGEGNSVITGPASSNTTGQDQQKLELDLQFFKRAFEEVNALQKLGKTWSKKRMTEAAERAVEYFEQEKVKTHFTYEVETPSCAPSDPTLLSCRLATKCDCYSFKVRLQGPHDSKIPCSSGWLCVGDQRRHKPCQLGSFVSFPTVDTFWPSDTSTVYASLFPESTGPRCRSPIKHGSGSVGLERTTGDTSRHSHSLDQVTAVKA